MSKENQIMTTPLRKIFERLSSPDGTSRMAASEELGDLLEYGDLPRDDIEEAVSRLIKSVVSEAVGETREAMTNALATAGCSHPRTAAPWALLASALGAFDEQSLEHALCALGFSGEQDTVDSIRRFLDHDTASIRESASEALTELGLAGENRASS
jgi:HEAT repeat protein